MLLRSCLLFFFVSIIYVKGQDSIVIVKDSSTTSPFVFQYLDTDFGSIDSSLTPDDIDKFNPYNRELNYYYNLGNLMTKGHYKTYQSETEYTFIRSAGDFGYLSDFVSKEDVPLLKVKTPIAELHYIGVYKRGSHFGGYFSQNITENWNYYLSYTRTHSEGRYFRQETVYDNLSLSSNFKSKDKRYSAQAIVIWNKLKSEENGGIKNNVDFEENIVSARELVDINLWNSKGFGRKSQIFYKHSYSFNRDSVRTKGLGLFHKLDYKDQYYKFTSTDSIFDNYYFGNETNDSSHTRFLYNEGGVSWKTSDHLNTEFKIGAYYSLQKYSSEYYETGQNDLGLFLKYKSDFSLKNRLNFSAYCNLSNTGNSVRLDYERRLNKSSDIKVYASYNNKQADYFEQVFISNHYLWLNDFKNKQVLTTGLGYKFKDILNLDVKFTELNNFIYFNSDGRPVQLDQNISMVNGDIGVKVVGTKKLGVDLNVGFNQMITGSEFYRLPSFVTRSKIFWNYNVYNKALSGQYGVELKYFSSYQANNYNPVTGNFYLQNNTSIGDFFYLNGYASFQIKTLRVYVLVENLLQGLTPYNYYSVPNYAMVDRVFRLGFKWRFFN